MLLVRFTKLLFQRFLFSSLILKRCLHYFFRASISTIFVSFFSYVPLCGFHFFSSISRVDYYPLVILCKFEKNIPYRLFVYTLLYLSLRCSLREKYTFFGNTCEQGKVKIESLDKIDKKK